ncbi:hypothetical protein, partial [Amycolatopsis sp. NPDC000740]|uniref:hypothetical protein n=1 Tax=Amycolatopsis sp. NPDC000740 TaxID=3154269 RepID=UPI0033182A21
METNLDSGMGRNRRNSTILRTAPAGSERFTGYQKTPGFEGITTGYAQSWVPAGPPARPDVVIGVDDHEGTVALTAKIVHTLVRQLHNMEGELDLFAAERAAVKHEVPEVVLTAAVRFIAARPRLASLVKFVTDHRYEDGGVRAFPIPDGVSALLEYVPGSPRWFLGEWSSPVRMVPPVGPADPSGAPQPEVVLGSALVKDGKLDLTGVLMRPCVLGDGSRVGTLFPSPEDVRSERADKAVAGFKAGAVPADSYSMAMHSVKDAAGRVTGFSIWQEKSGSPGQYRQVLLSPAAWFYLLLAVAGPEAAARQRLIAFSCGVAPESGGLLQELQELADRVGRGQRVLGPDTRVKIEPSGRVVFDPGGSLREVGTDGSTVPSAVRLPNSAVSDSLLEGPGLVLEHPAVQPTVAALDRMADEHATLVPGQELLGPDVLQLRKRKPPMPALHGLNVPGLSAQQGAGLLSTMDMLRGAAPTPQETTPEALDRAGAGVEVLRAEWPPAVRQHWATVLGVPVGSLPAFWELPMVAFGIWLGGSLRAGEFWDNFGAAADRFDRVPFVLFTDIPRWQIDAVLAGDESDELAGVREMVSHANTHNVKLVNIDEISHSEMPMPSHPFVVTERSKESGLGYAPSSDILRIQLLHLFGGFYMDGDNVLEHLSGVRSVVNEHGFGVLEQIIREAAGERREPNNSGIVMTKGHPIGAALLYGMSENYRKTRRRLFDSYPGLVDVVEASLDSPMGRNRRNSTIPRVTPVGFARYTGYQKLPGFGGMRTGNAESWVPAGPPAQPDVLIGLDDQDGTVALTAKVVHTLVWQLHNREGELDLFAVERAIAKHEVPELVLTAAVRFIAARPGLASLVKFVTDHRYENGAIRAFPIPDAVRAMLAFVPGSPRWFLGEWSSPARMVAPGSAAGLPQPEVVAQSTLIVGGKVDLTGVLMRPCVSDDGTRVGTLFPSPEDVLSERADEAVAGLEAGAAPAGSYSMAMHAVKDAGGRVTGFSIWQEKPGSPGQYRRILLSPGGWFAVLSAVAGPEAAARSWLIAFSCGVAPASGGLLRQLQVLADRAGRGQHVVGPDTPVKIEPSGRVLFEPGGSLRKMSQDRKTLESAGRPPNSAESATLEEGPGLVLADGAALPVWGLFGNPAEWSSGVQPELVKRVLSAHQRQLDDWMRRGYGSADLQAEFERRWRDPRLVRLRAQLQQAVDAARGRAPGEWATVSDEAIGAMRDWSKWRQELRAAAEPEAALDESDLAVMAAMVLPPGVPAPFELSAAELELLLDLLKLMATRHPDWRRDPAPVRVLAGQLWSEFAALSREVDIPASVALDRALLERWSDLIERTEDGVASLKANVHDWNAAEQMAEAVLGEPGESVSARAIFDVHAAVAHGWAVEEGDSPYRAETFEALWAVPVMEEMRAVRAGRAAEADDFTVSVFRDRSASWTSRVLESAAETVPGTDGAASRWRALAAERLGFDQPPGAKLTGNAARLRMRLYRSLIERMAYHLARLDHVNGLGQADRVAFEEDRIDALDREAARLEGESLLVELALETGGALDAWLAGWEAWEAGAEPARAVALLGLETLVASDWPQMRELLDDELARVAPGMLTPAEAQHVDDMASLLEIARSQGTQARALENLAEALADDFAELRRTGNPPVPVAMARVEEAARAARMQALASGEWSSIGDAELAAEPVMPQLTAQAPLSSGEITRIDRFRDQHRDRLDQLWKAVGSAIPAASAAQFELGQRVSGSIEGLRGPARDLAEDVLLAHVAAMTAETTGARTDAWLRDVWSDPLLRELRSLAGEVLAPKLPASELALRLNRQGRLWGAAIAGAEAQLAASAAQWRSDSARLLGPLLGLLRSDSEDAPAERARALYDELVDAIAFVSWELDSTPGWNAEAVPEEWLRDVRTAFRDLRKAGAFETEADQRVADFRAVFATGFRNTFHREPPGRGAGPTAEDVRARWLKRGRNLVGVNNSRKQRSR